jgi:hypothetical protein
MAEEEASGAPDMEALKRTMQYPLIKVRAASAASLRSAAVQAARCLARAAGQRTETHGAVPAASPTPDRPFQRHCVPCPADANCSRRASLPALPPRGRVERAHARVAAQNCDMNEEMRSDCVDLTITAIERHAANYEAAARMVKEQMDKKYNENCKPSRPRQRRARAGDSRTASTLTARALLPPQGSW